MQLIDCDKGAMTTQSRNEFLFSKQIVKGDLDNHK